MRRLLAWDVLVQEGARKRRAQPADDDHGRRCSPRRARLCWASVRVPARYPIRPTRYSIASEWAAAKGGVSVCLSLPVYLSVCPVIRKNGLLLSRPGAEAGRAGPPLSRRTGSLPEGTSVPKSPPKCGLSRSAWSSCFCPARTRSGYSRRPSRRACCEPHVPQWQRFRRRNDSHHSKRRWLA
jgi:hypothetical protein